MSFADELARRLIDQSSVYEVAEWLANNADSVLPILRALERPVDMVLYCPKCGLQHIDAPEPHDADENEPRRPGGLWSNPPHKSHLCHGCEHIWRPSDTPTNGVATVASGKDSDTQPVSVELAAAMAVRECVVAVDSWMKLESADNLYGKGMQAGAAFAKAEIFKLSPASVLAKLDGLVADAERYRFIRGATFSLDQICGPMKGLPEGQFEGWEMFEGAELDAAIDAARRKA